MVVNEVLTFKPTEAKNQKVLTLDEFYADVEPSSQEMTEEEDFISTSDSEEDSSNQ